MLFNSYVFILLFLPVCLAGYYLISSKQSNVVGKLWLTGASLLFYGGFGIKYLLILLLSVGLNYIIYYLITDNSGVSRRKLLFVLGIAFNLGLLFYFKYTNFFIENTNALFGTSIVVQKILLPVGISFYTFRQIYFLADTYRLEVPACSFLDYLLFVTFFPLLLEGPISNHRDMLPQFREIGRKVWNSKQFVEGILFFIFGLSKKMILADTFGVAVDWGYQNAYQLNSTDGLLLILFYAIQLYFDFSGYCDMAIGIGKMMGIEVPVNFNSPYKAVSITDFWKRWHITLSRFFMHNVYIPLGGNRKGKVRMYANLFFIFILSGLWHGAGWAFMIWGLMHGVLYVITRALELHHKKLYESRIVRVVGRIFTFSYVSVAWVYFRSNSVTLANTVLQKAFSGNFALPNKEITDAFNLDEFWYVIKILHLDKLPGSNGYLCLLFTIVTVVIVFAGKNVAEIVERFRPKRINAILMAGLLLWCLVSISNVGTFLYLNF